MDDSTVDYISFDIPAIQKLKEVYEASAAALLEQLPRINYNSPEQIISMFRHRLNLSIKNARIVTIQGAASLFPEGSEEKELILTLLAYLRLKYSLKNYIYCILTHEVDGYVMLRWVGKDLCMPNKQPLSYNHEIQDCIQDWSSNVPNHVSDWMRHRKDNADGRNTSSE